jgi:pSer/pThr/pTyr-binding forkhead associated (FHA) protein
MKKFETFGQNWCMYLIRVPFLRMAFLYEVLEDGSLGELWPVGEQPLVVGRGGQADICLDDGALSRSHFLVVKEAGQFFVVDLDSENGTWVGAQRVKGHKLHSGETIQAGQSKFCFLVAAAASPAVESAGMRVTSPGRNSVAAS